PRGRLGSDAKGGGVDRERSESRPQYGAPSSPARDVPRSPPVPTGTEPTTGDRPANGAHRLAGPIGRLRLR
ncbi:MAG: hypothetical protein AAF411_18925, partial [Myxococcota bacterium]